MKKTILLCTIALVATSCNYFNRNKANVEEVKDTINVETIDTINVELTDSIELTKRDSLSEIGILKEKTDSVKQ